MKILLAVSAAAVLAAGCVTAGPETYAQADCKVAPIITSSYTGKPKAVSPIEQRWAEMQLGNTQYRRQQLAEHGMFNNNVEDALRDCDRATR